MKHLAIVLFAAMAMFGCSSPAHKILPTQINEKTIHQPFAKVVLHLDRIKAVQGVDNVQVFMTCVVPDPNGDPYQARAHVASLVFESAGFSGDKEIDVTDRFKNLLEYDPPVMTDFQVAFVIVPKNMGTHLDPDSFDVGETYFQMYDKDGHGL